MKKNQIDLYSTTVLWFCFAMASMVAVWSFSSYRHESSCVSWLYPCQVRGVAGQTADATSDVGCAAGIVVTVAVETVASLEFWREGTHSQGPPNTMGFSSMLNMEIPSPIHPSKGWTRTQGWSSPHSQTTMMTSSFTKMDTLTRDSLMSQWNLKANMEKTNHDMLLGYPLLFWPCRILSASPDVPARLVSPMVF